MTLLIVAVAAFSALPPGMRAQSENKAAVVVRQSEDDIRTFCVEFDEPQITGFDLLQRAGLELEIAVQGLGALVCRIDGTGCPFNDCLCQCAGGGDCIYWSYWHRLGADWQYSQAGSNAYKIEHGAIDGWSWGPGAANQAIAPPDITFADVCEESSTATPTPTPSPSATPLPPVVVTPLLGATRDFAPATQTTTATVSPSPTEMPVTAESATQTPLPTSTERLRTSQQTETPTSTADVPPAQQENTAVITVETPLSQPTLDETKSPRDLNIRIESEEDVEEAASPTPELSEPLVLEGENVGTPFGSSEAVAATAVAGISAEPAQPLTVIGSNIVPTAPLLDDNPTVPEIKDAVDIDWLSYAAFAIIVLGLGGLLAYFSLRRR